jgi:hypothetical protein
LSLYEILVLGAVSDEYRSALSKTIEKAIEEFKLRFGQDVMVRDADQALLRDPKASAVVAYFDSPESQDAEFAGRLLERGVPVIPVVREAGSFENLPTKLKMLNGLKVSATDPNMEALAAVILESVGLLRQQRRVFVSYRRTESRAAALQLHDLLASRGFDVFLDTHDIRPGEPFQEVLWHRMADSDVVIVLDTATYFERKWTREEFGKAMAREIHILRLVWPNHSPTAHLNTGEMVRLAPADLTTTKTLKKATAEEVAVSVERIRSRSIAARVRTLTGKLSAEVERIGARIEGVGAHHAVAVRLSRGRRVWAYPVVGIPTANALNEIAIRASDFDDGAPVLVYDHAGIRELWLKHLDWLDANIATVDAIKVFDAASRLIEMDT